MGVMIPERPRKFDPASLEGLMFQALEQLPDDYYVFHSFRITDVNDNVFHESETDFVIYNRKLGVICLEAKAGQVRYSNGEWLYGNGVPMHNDGPFNQASGNKHKLRQFIRNSNLAGVLDHCKFLHAVWFPSISNEQLHSMILPSEADPTIILTKEALENPEPFLHRIYEIEVLTNRGPVKTNVSENESKRLIREIFCPEFEVFPSVSFEADLKKMVFHRLLKEQSGILNFLEDQRTAAINGAAGTGKTMIAIEKARRHADEGDKVLFLCFNTQLKQYLEANYANKNIAYFTIAGFACKICDSATPDYNRVKEKLEEMYFSGAFPYKHVVIDEAQDFGLEVIEETDIVQLIHDIIVDHEESGGSFYVFYDKLQLIQAREMPKFIDELDCRLTLYRNCRNTQNIATTSLKPITERKPKLFEGATKGNPASLHFCVNEEDEIERIDAVISSLVAEGLKDLVILTCKTEFSSILSGMVKNGKYRNRYLFTTCRKYKGLEADAVILIDVDKNTFEGSNTLIFYVGASRARLRLEIFTMMSDGDCIEVLQSQFPQHGRIVKAKKDLSSALNAIGTLTT